MGKKECAGNQHFLLSPSTLIHAYVCDILMKKFCQKQSLQLVQIEKKYRLKNT